MVVATPRWFKWFKSDSTTSSTPSSREYSAAAWVTYRSSSGAPASMPSPNESAEERAMRVARWVRVTQALKAAEEVEAASQSSSEPSPEESSSENADEGSLSECSVHSAETIITPSIEETSKDVPQEREVERMWQFPKQGPFDPEALVEDLMEFQKFQVKHMPMKRMCFVVKTQRVDFSDWWCPAKQVVLFHEMQPPDPAFPPACFKAVFLRAGPAAGPWKLYDHRMPFGLLIPPTDGLDKMASLREATTWLRAVLTFLLAHEEREIAIQQLRQDRQLFSDPSTQVSSIGSIMLLLKFNFAIPAERRLQKSAYKLTVIAKFAGDCRLLPKDVELYSRGKRLYLVEEVLKVVQEDVVKTGRVSSSRARFDSPLVELVHGWWDALEFVVAGAEADAAAAAAAAAAARTPPSSSPSSSSGSSFPSLIVSPCKPSGVDPHRPATRRPTPAKSSPRSPAPRRLPRRPTPYRTPPRSPAPRRLPRRPTPYRAPPRSPTPQSTPPSSSPPRTHSPVSPAPYRPKPLSPSPPTLASRRPALHRPSPQYFPPLHLPPLSPSPPMLALQPPTPRSTPLPLASRRHAPETPRRGDDRRLGAPSPTAASPLGATPRKRGRLSAPRRLLKTSADTDRSRTRSSSQPSIATRRSRSPVIARRIRIRGISLTPDSEDSE